MASGSPVARDDGSWRNAMSSSLAARPASRRSSKRAMQCDDDMSSDDDKPLASVPLPPASSPTPATCSTLFGTYSLASRSTGTATKSPETSERSQMATESPQPNSAPPKRKAEIARLQTDLVPPMKSAATDSTRALPGVTSHRANQQADPAQLPRTAPKQKEGVKDTKRDANSGNSMSVSARVGECKARITELQKQKTELLDKEDYIGAHHMKQQVQEQEQLLVILKRQLDSMPTPARRASISASKIAVCSGRAGKSPGKVDRGRSACSGGQSPATLAPNANAFARSSQLQSALNRLNSTAPSQDASLSAANAPSQPQVSQEPKPDTSTDRPRFPSCQIGNAESLGPQEPHEEAKSGRTSFGSCSEGGGAESQAGSRASGSCSNIDEDEEPETFGQWRTASVAGCIELPRETEAKPGEVPFMIPRDIFYKLYPYQRAGVAWMARLWQEQQGGVLADEMGLGKTVQVCAFLNGARKAGASHALLLLPVSLLDQWAKEARKWCPGWPVHIFYGAPSERQAALRRLQRPQGGILLTSYQTLANQDTLFDVPIQDEPSPRRKKRKDAGLKRRKLGNDDEGEDFLSDEEEVFDPEMPGGGVPELGVRKPWDVIICDEAHRMKNISTLLGKTMRGVRASCRLLLTGTPVQNALQDLWSLMDFAQPGLLGNHTTFVKQFSDPIDRGSFGGASCYQIELKKHLAEQLRQLITPHLLRRTKVNAGLMAEEEDGNTGFEVEEDTGDGQAQAQKLPPKRESIIWLNSSKEQLDAYKKVLHESDVIRNACEQQKLGFEVFRAIGLLKRLCNHPALLLPMKEKNQWRDYLEEATAQVQANAAPGLEDASNEAAAEDMILSDAGPEQPPSADQADMQDDGTGAGVLSVESTLQALGRSREDILDYSSKLRCLNTLLPALSKRGHRTLIFSQSVKMLDLVQICCLKPNGLRCLRIDGQTDAKERADKVNKFNSEKGRDRFQCMLLTTSVGGVGLNLTSADRVVLVDPAWNPAIDAQAVDRAFRIGQTKEVKVYRLIMSGLIEDKMFRLQVFKMGLTKTALESDSKQQRYFSQREIRALFDWTDPEEGETRKMLLDKHGESDDNTRQSAADDGAEDPDSCWMRAAPAVGLSDFNKLYSSMAQEEDEGEPDAESAEQVIEAKEKLGAADEKLQQKQKARKGTEKKQEQVIKDLEQTNKNLETVKERRARVVEAVKEKNSELIQERRSETAAQQHLEKSHRVHVKASSSVSSTKQASMQADVESQSAANTAKDAAAQASNAVTAFDAASSDAMSQMALVQNDGSATRGGIVEVTTVGKLRALQKALEKANANLEKVGKSQTELDFAEAQLDTADAGLADAEKEIARLGDVSEGVRQRTAELNAKKFTQDRQKGETALAKAKEKVDTVRETAVNAVQACQEAAVGFAESLQKSEDTVKMDAVKAVQSRVKASFRQFKNACEALRKAREAHTKTLVARRKSLQKAWKAQVDLSEAEVTLEAAERELKTATEAEKRLRESRAVKEQALSKAEAAKNRTELEEAELKKRREEFKAETQAMKESVKAARTAEKEATNERQALHSNWGKVDKQRQQMEDSKNSAMQILQGEKYDPGQVEKAYEDKNN